MASIQEELRNRPYALEAYDFVLKALDRTLRRLSKKRHVSGQELVLGIRQHALDEFGPMASHVLEQWGLKSTHDFGTIVFTLVEQGLLSARAEDSPEDFDDAWDFAALEASYFQFRAVPGEA